MSRRAQADQGRLTAYEADQVRRIAAWKSEPPHPIAEMWKSVAWVGANLVEKVIPHRLVESAISGADDLADRLASQEDIKRQAGASVLSEMREKPMEDCDRLAERVGLSAIAMATAEGAATGAGGVFTTLLDIPLLFTLALRTIRKIGYCYGYEMEGERGTATVNGILITALSGSLDLRRKRLRRIHTMEDLLIEETEEDVITEEVLSLIFQLEVFEEVPGLGAISGAILNAAFMRRIEVTARRVFQERWLRDIGKVEEIEPAEAHPRLLATGITGALGRLAHSGCYSVGYGAALPVYAAAAMVARRSGRWTAPVLPA